MPWTTCPIPTRRPARRHHACQLVAHHSDAIVEAGERGLADVLGLEFEPAQHVLSAVLTPSCPTLQPARTANSSRLDRRLAEIHHRMPGPGHASNALAGHLRRAAEDWPKEGLNGRATKTVKKNDNCLPRPDPPHDRRLAATRTDSRRRALGADSGGLDDPSPVAVLALKILLKAGAHDQIATLAAPRSCRPRLAR